MVQLSSRGTEQVATVVAHALQNGLDVAEVNPKAKAVEEWVQTIIDTREPTKQFLAKCTPGQYSNEGDLDDPNANANRLFGGGCEEYFRILKE
ncbi:MAG: hypothetical protein OXQ89_21240, partial [Rhodospirillaceae bacterium]|nr:hypothetical protein [Rhodospirillaceae bacterium]